MMVFYQLISMYDRKEYDRQYYLKNKHNWIKRHEMKEFN